MYTVYCDGTPIYDIRDEELVLIEPKLSLELNKAGSFTFKIHPTHPEYENLKAMTSIIRVFQDDEEIFNGRIIETKTDFYNRKTVTCEGQLAYLKDSIQRPAEYHDMTVRGYLETLIACHNAQVDDYKKFEVGIVTVEDNNDSLFRYTNYNSTMSEITEDLIDDLGGYLRIRNVEGTHYIDYVKLEDYGNVNTQPIEFYENLVDFSRNIDLTELATVIIPQGTKLDESTIEALDLRLDISSVNKGKDYIENPEGVKQFGRIEKIVTWDDVTDPNILMRKGVDYISKQQLENLTIEAKATDLHYTDAEIERFSLGDRILIHSKLHGINRYFPLSKMTINLNDVSSNEVTLGALNDTSLSNQTVSLSNSINTINATTTSTSSILSRTEKKTTELIHDATHGNVITTATNQKIMNTDDESTATQIWEWGTDGLTYTSVGTDGNDFKVVLDMNGYVDGNTLKDASVSGDKLTEEYKTAVTTEITETVTSKIAEAIAGFDGDVIIGNKIFTFKNGLLTEVTDNATTTSLLSTT